MASYNDELQSKNCCVLERMKGRVEQGKAGRTFLYPSISSTSDSSCCCCSRMPSWMADSASSRLGRGGVCNAISVSG